MLLFFHRIYLHILVEHPVDIIFGSRIVYFSLAKLNWNQLQVGPKLVDFKPKQECPQAGVCCGEQIVLPSYAVR